MVENPTTFMFDVKNNIISSCGNYLAIYDNFQQAIIFKDLSHIYTSQEKKAVSLSKENLVPNMELKKSIAFSSLCFLFTNLYLLVGTKNGRLLKVPNPLLKNKQTERVMSISLASSDEVRFLSKSSYGTQLLAVTDCSIKDSNPRFHIVNCSDLTLEHTVISEKLKMDGKVSAVCFPTPKSKEYTLLVGTTSCKIYVISVKSYSGDYKSQVLQCLTNHRSPITVLNLSWDERVLISGSTGLTKRLWKSQVSSHR